LRRADASGITRLAHAPWFLSASRLFGGSTLP
jgi:hypothetical protein